MLGLAMLLSSQLFAAEAVISNENFDSDTVQKEEVNDRELADQLRRVKDMLTRGNTSRAIQRLDRIIDRLDRGGQPGQTFNRIGIVYNTNNSRFRCSLSDERRAMDIGANSARDFCYRAGNTSCQVVSNVITANGYLGYINGTYYGYGCTASAVVRGTR